MNRTSLLSLFVVAGAAAVLLAGTAQSQSGVPKNQVVLQPTTPGTSQSGHLNVSGTARAGQFVGGGAGITGVNADTLDGINSTAFLQAVPNPLSLSGSPTTPIITGTNSGSTTGSAGVKGVASSATGTVYGLWGSTTSSSGRGVFGEATSTSGATYGGRFESDSISGRGVYGLATATTGSAYGVFGQSQSATGRGIFGSASATTGINYGGYFDSNSVDGYGVFANSAGTYGMYGLTTQTSGTAYGVYGQSAAFTGYGIYGEATSTTGSNYGGRFNNVSTAGGGIYASALSATGSTFGGRFESNSTSGRGVFGYAAATSGTTYGVWGQSDSSSGRGVYGRSATGTGGYFSSDSGDSMRAIMTGTGRAGLFEINNTSNQEYALQVTTNGPSTSAIFAEATGGSSSAGTFESSSTFTEALVGRSTATTSSSVGVYGISHSVSGFGVQGTALADTGVCIGGRFESQSDDGRGVFGFASDPGGGFTYGVYGQNSATSPGYGVYANGDSGASGTKSFRIDHPADPENKYLLHYSSESPFPQNFYNGNIVTDSTGYAWVELPDYFAEINTNFKYILTVVDESDSNDFIWAKVVQKIRNNRFRIRTHKPNVEVSWEVKADRNDARIQFRRPVDVQEKTGPERGKYQNPEYYGKPESMGMDYELTVGSALTKQSIRTKARSKPIAK